MSSYVVLYILPSFLLLSIALGVCKLAATPKNPGLGITWKGRPKTGVARVVTIRNLSEYDLI